MGFETRAHMAKNLTPTGAITVPVYQTTTYEQDESVKIEGKSIREQEITRDALEVSVAALEGAEYGRAFASGMAAEDTILRLLNPGDHIVMGNDAYGGTFRLISKVLTRMGVTWSAADLSKKENLENCLTDKTRIIWAETPSNPLYPLLTSKCSRKYRIPLARGASSIIHSLLLIFSSHSHMVLTL